MTGEDFNPLKTIMLAESLDLTLKKIVKDPFTLVAHKSTILLQGKACMSYQYCFE